MDRPCLKSYIMVVTPGRLRLVGDRDAELLLADPEGWVQALIELMNGKRGRSALRQALAGRWPDVTDGNVAAVIDVLDTAGFVDDAQIWAYLPPPRQATYELASWHEAARVAMSG